MKSMMVEMTYTGIASMSKMHTRIKLKCDRSRSGPDDALFNVTYDRRWNITAELHHLCCCPDGCPPVDDDKTMVIVVVAVVFGLVAFAVVIACMCLATGTHLQIYLKLPELKAVSSYGSGRLGSMENGLRHSGKKFGAAFRDYEPAPTLIQEKKPLPVLDDCIIPGDDLEVQQRLGGGLFADTYIAQWLDKTVAIKRLTVNIHGQTQLSPKNLATMRQDISFLSSHRHKNIIGMLGLSLDGKHPVVITDFVDGECLKDYCRSRGPNLLWPQRISICMQAADGMAFLHSNKPPVLHRDLRCANIFITLQDIVKVGDFGMVKLIQPMRDSCKKDGCCCRREMSGCPAAIRWTAPEILHKPNSNDHGDIVTTACDVYSFGMTMWEMIICEDPFDDISSDEEVMEAVKSGIRPEIKISEDMFPKYKDLVEDCWEGSHMKRPTFKQIAVRLKEMLRYSRAFQKTLNIKQRLKKLQPANS